MQLKNTTTTYGSVAKFFHWLIALLVICMLIYGFILPSTPKQYWGMLYNIHKLTGLTLLCLMILRLGWALINVKPLLPADTTPLERSLERIVHFLIYVTVIAMPLVGWIGTSASGRPPHIGKLELAFPIAQNKATGEALLSVHGVIAIIIIVLLSIHILAAFYHYFVRKDNVMQTMLPE